MTFKNVIFGFNFCQKRQVKFHLRSKPDFNIDLIHYHYHRNEKRPTIAVFDWKYKFPEISWLFRHYNFSPENENFSKKM